MKLLSRFVLACGVLALISANASAQGQGRGFQFGFGGGAGGAGALIRNEGVQKELKLTEEQTTKAMEVVTEIQQKHADDFAKLRDPDLDMAERMQKMQAIQKVIAEETTKGLDSVLKPEQTKRLKQIDLQQRGLLAFSSPEVEKVLKLTDEQKEKLKTINEDMAGEMRSLFQDAQGNFQELQPKMATLRKETFAKGVAILTAEQKTSWKEMTGEPFEVKFELGAFGKGKGKRKDK